MANYAIYMTVEKAITRLRIMLRQNILICVYTRYRMSSTVNMTRIAIVGGQGGLPLFCFLLAYRSCGDSGGKRVVPM